VTSMPSTSELLAQHGIPEASGIPSSAKTFPDGVRFRIEIPSVEGPACVPVVLEEADRRSVPVRRISPGSDVFMLTDDEREEGVELAGGAGIEVSLFERPVTGCGVSATARASADDAFAAAVQGTAGLAAAIDDIGRLAEHGVRSSLASDCSRSSASYVTQVTCPATCRRRSRSCYLSPIRRLQRYSSSSGPTL